MVITVFILCACSIAAEVDTDQPSYAVSEDVGQLEVLIEITSASGRECECELSFTTADDSATGLKRL